MLAHSLFPNILSDHNERSGVMVVLCAGMVVRYVKRTCLALICFNCFLLVQVAPSRALDVKVINNPAAKECSHHLSGEVKAGDLGKIKALIENQEPYFVPKYCLDILGGNFQEALRISEFILERGGMMEIPKGSRCFSACTLLFMSGNLPTESGKGILLYRMLHKEAQLGFHAPYVSFESGVYPAETINLTYEAAMKIIAAFMRLADEMRFDHSLISNMLSKGSSEVFRIHTIDDVGRWNIQLSGYAIPRQITFEMLGRACHNNFAWWGSDRTIITRGSRQGYEGNSAVTFYDQAPPDYEFKKVKSERQNYSGGESWKQSDFYEAGWYGPDGALVCSIEVTSTDKGGTSVSVGYRYEGEKIEWLTRQPVPSWQYLEPATPLNLVGDGDGRDF